MFTRTADGKYTLNNPNDAELVAKLTRRMYEIAAAGGDEFTGLGAELIAECAAYYYDWESMLILSMTARSALAVKKEDNMLKRWRRTQRIKKQFSRFIMALNKLFSPSPALLTFISTKHGTRLKP